MRMEFKEKNRVCGLRLSQIEDGHFISYIGSEKHIGIKVAGCAVWPSTNLVNTAHDSGGSDLYIDLGPYDLVLHQ